MDEMADYSKYTLEQLYDVYHHIDKEKYQDRFTIVVQEIEKRKSEAKEGIAAPDTRTATSRWRKPLAVTEVMGGLFLLYGSIIMTYSTGTSLLLHTIGSFSLGCIAIWAGIALYKDTPLGTKLSLFLQGLQLFSISTSKVFILLVAGLNAKLTLIYSSDTLQEKGWQMSYGINGTFLVDGPGHNQPLGVGVNLFALGALLLLFFKNRGERPDTAKVNSN